MRSAVALAIASFFFCACSQTSNPPAARIIGTNALAQIGDLLFVTSTDRAELRALDVAPNPRDFVRAPNPLEPLSIPVLERPVSLARDIRYDGSGQEVAGPYLYAQGQASADISIVGTDRATQLVELGRVATPGVVTAIAARGPSATGQTSTLYYATLNGSDAQLWRLPIPASDASGRLGGPISAGSATLLHFGPGESTTGDPITSLLVLPDQRLVVASRNASTKTGRTIVLDPIAPPGQQQRLLNFPSAVRMLATHSKVSDALPAAARVFAALDEDSCGAGPTCSGVLAVDTKDPASSRYGQIALDATGAPMAQMKFGGALPTGLTIASSVPLLIPGSDPTTPAVSLLGIVSTSNGIIDFFDATALRFIDVGGDVAKALTVGYVAPDGTLLTDSSSTAYPPGPKPETLVLAHGAGLDETVLIVYQGTIAGMRDVRVSEGPIRANQVSVDASVAMRAAADDRVQFSTGCLPVEVRISGVAPSGAITTDQFECTGRGPFTFSVRAAGTQPFAVEGTATGYMGRVANNQSFAFPSDPVPDVQRQLRRDRYFFHAPNYNPNNPDPQIQFTMGPGPTDPPRDSRYAILTVSNFAPEFVALDVSIGVEFHLPGSVVYIGTLPSGDVLRFFVAYPSANAIVEFNPAAFSPNQANARFLSVYR